MIILPPGNRILRETVAAIILRDEEDKPATGEQPMDVKLCDFDDVMYHVVITPEDKTHMIVEMRLPCYHEIEGDGGKEAFEAAFEGMVKTDPSPSHHVAISIDLEKLPAEEEAREALVHKICTMKAITVGGVFHRNYKALEEGKQAELKPKQYEIRGDTTVYFIPGKDRVTTIFALDYREEVDRVVAGVFMNEMKLSQRKVNGAPPTSWMTTPPDELKTSFDINENPNNCLGFISFAVLKRHIDKPENADTVVHTLQTFRTFIQYHIKMSKSYWHSKMRSKCLDLLKVLNRAKIDDPNAKNNKKTSSGKTFKR